MGEFSTKSMRFTLMDSATTLRCVHNRKKIRQNWISVSGMIHTLKQKQLRGAYREIGIFVGGRRVLNERVAGGIVHHHREGKLTINASAHERQLCDYLRHFGPNLRSSIGSGCVVSRCVTSTGRTARDGVSFRSGTMEQKLY